MSYMSITRAIDPFECAREAAHNVSLKGTSPSRGCHVGVAARVRAHGPTVASRAPLFSELPSRPNLTLSTDSNASCDCTIARTSRRAPPAISLPLLRTLSTLHSALSTSFLYPSTHTHNTATAPTLRDVITMEDTSDMVSYDICAMTAPYSKTSMLTSRLGSGLLLRSRCQPSQQQQRRNACTQRRR